MKINVTGKDMKINDALLSKIEGKLSKFHRFFGDNAVANVKIEPYHNNEVRTEITMKIDSHYYRAETTAPEVIQAVQAAIDIMEGQIRKHKTRIKRQKQQYSYMKDYLEAAPAEETEEAQQPQIIRRKSFVIVPMDAEEAVLQMEMLGHDFLLFLNAETGKVALVYRRTDDNYGLIEPEY